MNRLLQFYHSPDEGGGGGGENIDVEVALDETPVVTDTGTIEAAPSPPSKEQVKAFARTFLEEEGYEVVQKGAQKGQTIKGTDIPTDLVSQEDWDMLAEGEQKAMKFSWDLAKKSAQATQHLNQKQNAPFLRESAITQLSEGLSEVEIKALRKNIAEIEAEEGVTFSAPDGGFKPSVAKLYREAAKSTAKSIPTKVVVGKETPGDTSGIDLTAEEQEVFDDWKKMGGNPTKERIRELLKNKKATNSGYLMEPLNA